MGCFGLFLVFWSVVVLWLSRSSPESWVQEYGFQASEIGKQVLEQGRFHLTETWKTLISKRARCGNVLDSVRDALSDAFPGEGEFVERVAMTMANARASNNTSSSFRLIGAPGAGKRKMASILACTLFPGMADDEGDSGLPSWPSNAYVQSFSSPNPHFLDNVKTAMNESRSSIVLVFENFAKADSHFWTGLNDLMSSQTWKDRSNLVFFVDDIGRNTGLLERIKLHAFLDEAQAVVNEALKAVLPKEALATRTVNIPFVPKSARTMEAHIVRICQSVNKVLLANFELVCDATAVAQAAMKLESCTDTIGSFPVFARFKTAFEASLRKFAENKVDTPSVLFAINLDSKHGSQSCTPDQMEKWITFKPLQAFT